MAESRWARAKASRAPSSRATPCEWLSSPLPASGAAPDSNADLPTMLEVEKRRPPRPRSLLQQQLEGLPPGPPPEVEVPAVFDKSLEEAMADGWEAAVGLTASDGDGPLALPASSSAAHPRWRRRLLPCPPRCRGTCEVCNDWTCDLEADHEGPCRCGCDIPQPDRSGEAGAQRRASRQTRTRLAEFDC